MVEFGTSAELGKSQEVYIKEHNGYYKLKLLKKVIYDLNNENLESSVLLAKNIYDFNHHISFARVLCHLIYSAFISKVLDASLLIKFLNSNEWCEKGLSKNKSAMIRDFSRFLLNINSEESNYLIGIMLEQNLINTKIIKERKTLYFSHYKSEEDIKNSKYYEFSQTFFENIDELKRNDWELHKKYVKEGINQSEITKIIRNDEIEKLQEISSQANFDFNQTIEPSLYERCSYINHNNVTLIDYAAFFSAVKCFKFLLLNGSNINETGKYAVAGGNEEIIHLCIQNHSTFEDAYEAAILFHRNNIFKYLYDNKIIETIDLCTLGVKCIQYDNYEILSFLESEGMNMNYKLIDETAKIGNIYLLKYFLKKNRIYNTTLSKSVESGNIEVVKYVLKQNGVDINSKDENKSTPLMLASKYGFTDIAKLLLENEKIDVNIKDNSGCVPLMIACSGGHIEIVKLLLNKKGIYINTKNNYGYTALMKACSNGYTKVVEILLKNELIDVNIKDAILIHSKFK